MQAYPYLIVALVLVMTWTLVLAFELDLRVGATASVIALLALVAFLGWQWFRRSRRASSKPARGTVNEDPSPGTFAPGAVQTQQAETRIREIHRALTTLADSRLHDARYALPWYLMIGPTGAGKSTIVRDSGLTFSKTTLENWGQGSHATSTDHLHLWLGDRAVLADCAGRYTSDPAALAEWNALMGTVDRLRPGQSLEAVVIVLPIGDLQTLNPSQLTELGEQLRRQTQSVNEILGRNHPVYILLSQSDRLPGFSTFSSYLGAQEKRGPWGWTWPHHEGQQSQEELARNGFRELCNAVHERCMQEVMRETSVARAEDMHRFSRGLSKLRSPLCTVVASLCAQSLAHDPILIRGVHLTGTSPQRDAPQSAARPQLFNGTFATFTQLSPSSGQLFLDGYLDAVVLPDKGLARLGRRARRHKKRRQAVVATVGLVGALSCSTLPLLSARNNKELQTQFKRVVQEIHAMQGGTMSLHESEAAWHRAALVDARLASVHEGTALTYRFGMYQGKTLHLASRKLFLELTQTRGIEPLLKSDAYILQELASQLQPLSSTQSQELRDSLFRYLLLTKAAKGTQPEVDGKVQERLVELIAQQWKLLGHLSDETIARDIALRYLHHIKQDPELAFPRNPQLIAQARARLLQVDPMLAKARTLIDSLNQSRPPITLKDLVDPRVMSNANRKIRGAYTRRAWEHRIRDGFDRLVDQQFDGEWLLGLSAQDEAARRRDRKARLYDHYLRAYEKEWRTFIDAIEILVPNYEEEFISTLGELGRRNQSPLLALTSTVDWNTQLQERRRLPTSVKAAAQGALDKAKAMVAKDAPVPDQRFMTVSTLRSTFLPFIRFGVSTTAVAHQGADNGTGPANTPPAQSSPAPDLARYLELVRSLRAMLQDAVDDRSARRSRQSKVATLATQVQSLAQEQNPSWRDWFERVLYAPFHYARTTQQSQRERALEQAWCDVAREMNDKIWSRYPFFAQASQDVDLVELGELLHPKHGALWKWRREVMAGQIEEKGEGFERSSQTSRHRSVDRRVIAFLNAAANAARTIYPPGQKTPKFAFEIEAKPQRGIQRTEFGLNGQSYVYANGSEHSQTMTWPGDQIAQKATILAKHANGELRLEKEGVWGLFRLLEAGQIQSAPQARSIVVTWGTQSRAQPNATIHLKALRTPSPLIPEGRAGFLAPLRNPALSTRAGILVGSPRCK